MSIVTKRGDSGLTSLLCGSRVRKDDLRIEACGALDELNSFLGLSKSLSRYRAAKKIIDTAQRDLFVIGSEIASGKFSYRLKKRIGQENIEALESTIERLEKDYKTKRLSFIIPGENSLSAIFDIARTVARRAERRTVTLKNKGMIKNKHIIIYLNRLSDLLYLLARSYEK
jgi:cob(I)alamin adenosyltransferase